MSLNNFKPSVVKGLMEQTSSVVLRNARVDSALITTFSAGEAVKLSGYQDGIIITPITASTDDIYGFVPYTMKKDTFEKNDVVRVVVDNCILVCEAGEPIVVGAKLEFDPATKKVMVQTTGSLVGTALESGDDTSLIKVELKK